MGEWKKNNILFKYIYMIVYYDVLLLYCTWLTVRTTTVWYLYCNVLDCTYYCTKNNVDLLCCTTVVFRMCAGCLLWQNSLNCCIAPGTKKLPQISVNNFKEIVVVTNASWIHHSRQRQQLRHEQTLAPVLAAAGTPVMVELEPFRVRTNTCSYYHTIILYL